MQYIETRNEENLSEVMIQSDPKFDLYIGVD